MKKYWFILLSLIVIFFSTMVYPHNYVQTTPDHFTIAVLPDTQFYAKNYPAIFNQQAQWIVDNAEVQNIVFVTQLGDLQEDYDNPTEWQNAEHSMAIIRTAGIPYSVVPGNHDLNFGAGDPTNFDTYFPYTDFTGYSWYGGHFSETSNTSNYELFSAMGQNFIILNLVCDSTLLNHATDWANQILTQYSDRKAIVVTHGYIDTDGNHISTSNTSGIAVWNNIVQDHKNIVAVLCGHIPGEYYCKDTGADGNTIYNLLTDYQSLDNGGDGWLRLYEFFPQLNKISAMTYSPYLNRYDTSTYGQFDLPLNMTTSKPVWDLNGDHSCNIGDVVMIGLYWEQTDTPGWIPEDINNDGVINIGDVTVIGLHWGETW